MKKEDSSEQGKIVTELMQHLHGCKNNCDVFFGRTEELERMKNYIVGGSNKPFVMYGAGGSGKSSMLSMTAYKAVNHWLSGSEPILFVRFCGTTPNSTSLGPLLRCTNPDPPHAQVYLPAALLHLPPSVRGHP